MLQCVTEATRLNEKKMMKHFCYLAHRIVIHLQTIYIPIAIVCMLVDADKAGRLIYFGYARCPVLVYVGSISSRFDSVFPLHSVSLEFTLLPFAFNYTCNVAFFFFFFFYHSISQSLFLSISLVRALVSLFRFGINTPLARSSLSLLYYFKCLSGINH